MRQRSSPRTTAGPFRLAYAGNSLVAHAMPDESYPAFASSEVNLLIYHYLKESGFLHTCFTFRYEARLDDLPAAREPRVHPGQLLGYLQRGLLYATAERHVREHGPKEVVPTPDPLIPVNAAAPLALPPVQPPAQFAHRDASSQTMLHSESMQFAAVDEEKRVASRAEGTDEEKRVTERTDDKTEKHGSDNRPLDADAHNDGDSKRRTIAGEPTDDDSPRRKKSRKGSHTHRPHRPDAPTAGPSGARMPKPDAPAPHDPNARVFLGHSAEVFVSAWNPTVPKLLASGAGDATVRIWDLAADGEPPAVCKHLPPTHAKNVATVAWNPDGTLLASGSYDGILRLWTPQGDLHLVMSMHQGPIFAVRWNRKGNLLLTGSADGTAIVWDVGSGRTRQQFSLHSDNVLDVQWLTDSPTTQQHPNPSAADAVFATCSADNSVQVCKLGEPKPLLSLVSHEDEINAIRFDPSQTLLASASDDGTACIWAVDVPGVATPPDAPSGHSGDVLLHTLRGHKCEVYALMWSPVGPMSGHPEQPRMLATASFDHTARLWNADTGECVRVIEGHDSSVYALCFSPCGQYLATGGIDNRVLVTRLSVRVIKYET